MAYWLEITRLRNHFRIARNYIEQHFGKEHAAAMCERINVAESKA